MMNWIRFSLVVGLLAGLLLPSAEAGKAPSPPKDVAAAYLTAIEASDLDAAAALFAESSSVFESGGVEGSWEHYREHHLGPEIGAIKSFVIDRKKPEVVTSKDDTLAGVTWPIEYRIELGDGRTIRSRGTVTFVLAVEKGARKIRHLHWSSRRLEP